MSKIISLVTILFAALTFFSVSTEIKADDKYDQSIPADTNIGNYIYEDKEYLTQNQVDQINALNKKLHNKENITLVIIDKIPLEDYSLTSAPLSDDEQRQYYVSKLTDKFHDSDFEKYMFADNEFYTDLANGRNYLIVSLKDKKAYWEPSSETSRYLTDYKFWKMKFWYEPALHSFDKQHQIDAALKLTQKLATEIQPFTNSTSPDKESSSFEDINEKFANVKFFFKAIFFIFIFGIILVIIFSIIAAPVSLGSTLWITLFDREK